MIINPSYKDFKNHQERALDPTVPINSESMLNAIDTSFKAISLHAPGFQNNSNFISTGLQHTGTIVNDNIELYIGSGICSIDRQIITFTEGFQFSFKKPQFDTTYYIVVDYTFLKTYPPNIAQLKVVEAANIADEGVRAIGQYKFIVGSDDDSEEDSIERLADDEYVMPQLKSKSHQLGPLIKNLKTFLKQGQPVYYAEGADYDKGFWVQMGGKWYESLIESNSSKPHPGNPSWFSLEVNATDFSIAYKRIELTRKLLFDQLPFWQDSYNYTKEDWVKHNGKNWMCRVEGTSVEPAEDIEEWSLISLDLNKYVTKKLLAQSMERVTELEAKNLELKKEIADVREELLNYGLPKREYVAVISVGADDDKTRFKLPLTNQIIGDVLSVVIHMPDEDIPYDRGLESSDKAVFVTEKEKDLSKADGATVVYCSK